jgi:hypothetical protein
MSRKFQYITIIVLSMIPAIFAIFAYLDVIDKTTITFVLILTSYIYAGIAYIIVQPLYKYEKDDLFQQQIQDISTSLKHASGILSSLGIELRARQDKLDKFKIQSVTAKKILSTLTQEEFDAVVAIIRASMPKARTKDLFISFILGVATNIFTFLLLG